LRLAFIGHRLQKFAKRIFAKAINFCNLRSC